MSSAPNYTPLVRRLRMDDSPIEREAASAIQWLQRRVDLLEADNKMLTAALMASAETIRRVHEETK